MTGESIRLSGVLDSQQKERVAMKSRPKSGQHKQAQEYSDLRDAHHPVRQSESIPKRMIDYNIRDKAKSNICMGSSSEIPILQRQWQMPFPAQSKEAWYWSIAIFITHFPSSHAPVCHSRLRHYLLRPDLHKKVTVTSHLSHHLQKNTKHPGDRSFNISSTWTNIHFSIIARRRSKNRKLSTDNSHPIRSLSTYSGHETQPPNPTAKSPQSQRPQSFIQPQSIFLTLS